MSSESVPLEAEQSHLSRRGFIKVTAIAGGGMAFEYVRGNSMPGLLPQTQARAFGADLQPRNANDFGPFLSLLPDNTVEFVLDRVEMGQGTYTSHVALLCEELEFPVSEVKVLHAGANKAYNNTMFASQMTGGSTSIAEGHEKIRFAGAYARERLRLAAAAQFNVKPEALTLMAGEVFVTESPAMKATYGSLAAAAAQIPESKVDQVKLKAWASQRLVGKPLPRQDAALKSTGKAVYGIDFAPPGSKFALFVRPPTLGAELESFDDSEVKTKTGIVKVLRVGNAIAIVAHKYWQAKATQPFLKVKWNTQKAFLLSSSEILEIHKKKSLEAGSSSRSDGDYAKAFRAATNKVQADYVLPYLAHATMEPQNATVRYRAEPQPEKGGRSEAKYEIWAPSQVPDMVVSLLAEALQCKREEISYHNCFLGGGFGRRLTVDYILEAAELAKNAALAEPIQVIWSREDDMKNDDYRPMSVCHMLGSVDDKGNISSFFYRNASQSIIRQFAPRMTRSMTPQWLPSGLTRFLGNTMSAFAAGLVTVEGVKDLPYKCPNVRVEYSEVELPVRVGFWRSVGHSINGFVVESFVDELAHLAKKDPYEFRKSHLAENDRRLHVLNQVAALAGWGKTLPSGVFEGIAVHKSFESYVAQVARISVQNNWIKVEEVYSVVDCGRVVNPAVVKSQIESGIVFGLSALLNGEITFEKGEVQQSNFNDYSVLRNNQHPRLIVEIKESEEAPTGVGEPGTPLIAAAVCNALFVATGKRIRSLPLSRSFV